MNPFATRMSGNAWVLPVSALSLVLGFMVMTASITDSASRSSRFQLLGPAQKDRVGTGTLDQQEQYKSMSEEVKNLRAENDKLQKALGDRNSSTKVLNEGIENAKAFAGLTEFQGPGLKITLTDSRKAPVGIQTNDAIIHDTDVLKVTNELFAAGAEAIDVNGHRVVTNTSFRCVGPVIHVDGVPVASPIAIRAIGDPATLEGGLNLPLGVLAEIRQTDPAMVQIEQVKDMRIAAYGGSTERKFAKVPAVKQ